MKISRTTAEIGENSFSGRLLMYKIPIISDFSETPKQREYVHIKSSFIIVVNVSSLHLFIQSEIQGHLSNPSKM